MKQKSNRQKDDISVAQMLATIRTLPADPPVKSHKWYLTEKEHWINWLEQYHGPGYYNRKVGTKRDARFVYNHIVEPKMLLWLAKAAGIRNELIANATPGARTQLSMNQQAAKVRKLIPWDMVAEKLLGKIRANE